MNLAHAASAASAAADDALLVARYVAGDDHAFTTLLLRHQARVFTTILLIVRERAVAEDLTQDTFLKALRTLRQGRYTETDRFRQWVCQIAYNLAINVKRRQRRVPIVSLDAACEAGTSGAAKPLASYLAHPDTHAQSPEALTIREEVNARLRRLIEELPTNQQQVVLLRHYGDLSFAEIAATTGVGTSTAASRMRRALLTLRKRITAAGTTATLVVAALAGGVSLTAPPTFSSPSPNDSSFYPRPAAAVRLQRAAS